MGIFVQLEENGEILSHPDLLFPWLDRENRRGGGPDDLQAFITRVDELTR
jgi:hypothetical protein